MIPYHAPLTPAQQHEVGLEETWPLAIMDRVRFAEIDMLGHVNNVAYLAWFETARVSYFQHIDLTTYAAQDEEPRIVIRRGEIDWLKEITGSPDHVTASRTIAYRNTSFTMRQELRVDGTIRATFRCVIVLLTPDGTARLAIPEPIRKVFDAEGAARE